MGVKHGQAFFRIGGQPTGPIAKRRHHRAELGFRGHKKTPPDPDQGQHQKIAYPTSLGYPIGRAGNKVKPLGRNQLWLEFLRGVGYTSTARHQPFAKS
jgi:hypothetical protein